MLEKLTLSEIKVGMEVEIDQLSEIYDTWIFVILEHKGDRKGIIGFIGPKPNSESQKLFDLGKMIHVEYNDSIMDNDEVSFDE